MAQLEVKHHGWARRPLRRPAPSGSTIRSRRRRRRVNLLSQPHLRRLFCRSFENSSTEGPSCEDYFPIAAGPQAYREQIVLVRTHMDRVRRKA